MAAAPSALRSAGQRPAPGEPATFARRSRGGEGRSGQGALCLEASLGPPLLLPHFANHPAPQRR
eukprot:2491160-Pleurochrysis_carterae.AAC.1